MTIDRFIIIIDDNKTIHSSELPWDLQIAFDLIRNEPAKHAEFFAALIKRGL